MTSRLSRPVLNRRVSALLVCCLLLFAGTARAHPNLQFDPLTNRDGLSQPSVMDIVQGPQGFLWFATYDGLNRYDGKRFKIYRSQPGKDGTLTDNGIRTLLVDGRGTLWVGTSSGGLNRYDRERDAFVAYRHDPDDPTSISSDEVHSLFEDAQGELWIGTYSGLNRFVPKDGTFVRYDFDPADPHSLAGTRVHCIDQDPSGALWVGTDGGACRLDRKTGTFTRFVPGPGLNPDIWSLRAESPDIVWLGSGQSGAYVLDVNRGVFERRLTWATKVLSMYVDSRDNFWVGTESGLAMQEHHSRDPLARAQRAFERFTHNPYDSFSLVNDQVKCIFEDRGGVLWFGSYTGGLSKYDPVRQAWGYMRNEFWNPRSPVPGNYVRALLLDRDGYLWIGSDDKGLNRYDRRTGEVLTFRADGTGDRPFPHRMISCLAEGRDNMLWVGTSNVGIVGLDRTTGRIRRQYLHDPNDPNSLSQNNVYWILEDSDGVLWAGTSKSGLNRLDDPEAGRFTRFLPDPDDPGSIGHKRVRTIVEAADGRLWLGTNAGLNRLDRKTLRFEHWSHDPDDPHSITNNRVTVVIENTDGTLWLGTDSGLNLFDPATEQARRWTVKDGLDNDSIQGMHKDSEGRIWMATWTGVSVLDPVDGSIRNYDHNDVQALGYWFNCYSSGPDGWVAFGGDSGINLFRPENIRRNETPPKVVLTGFRIENEPADLGRNVTTISDVTVSHEDSFFSFSFAALDFANPEKNRYAYKLEGFDKHWVDNENTGTATYTNFDQGEYAFRVRAANSDGVWNDNGLVVRVHVTPPFWKTTWFRILALAALLLAIVGTVKLRTRSLRLQKAVLASIVEEKTSALQREIDERVQIEAALLEARDSLELRVEERTEELRRSGEQLRKLSGKIMSAQEEERRRVGRELHDGIAQTLSAVSLHLANERTRLQEACPKQDLSMLDRLVGYLQESIAEIRRIISDFVPFGLDDLGIEAALKAQAEKARLADGRIHLEIQVGPGLEDMSMEGTQALYRVVQEALNNIVKHSRATHAVVFLERLERSVILEVRDNGIGFEPDEATGTGVGVASMRERADIVGGTLTIVSAPDEGTTVRAEFPLDGLVAS